MKNTSNFLLLYTLVGGLLFTCLFWSERLALNLLIYSLYIIGITCLNPEMIKGEKFKIYAAAHLAAAILVILNNSSLTLFSYYFSMLLFIGFSYHNQIRTIFTAIATAVLQLITVPINLFMSLSAVSIGGFHLKPVLNLVKYILLPAFIVIFFTILYSAANDVFAHYVESVFTHLSTWVTALFNLFFEDLDFVRILHSCLGTILTGALLHKFYSNRLEKAETICREDLERDSTERPKKTVWQEAIELLMGSFLNKRLALKTEYIIGMISFFALNMLLLMVNLIDITTLWFGYVPKGNFSADLHQGTYALIFSIIMAMAVILYFFRGNLNFYSKSKMLRMLAFVWMAQNVVLIISVLIRDGFYIEYYGLTHKRIGVLVFALLCTIGLATVYIKVARQKTLFYLFKINGYIWFALLLAFSTINWDVLIVKYNISRSDSIAIDPDYLLSLSDKTLPVLDKNREKLKATFRRSPQNTYDSGETATGLATDEILKQLDKRIQYFKNRYEKDSWLSWNLQDWNTAAHFKLHDH